MRGPSNLECGRPGEGETLQPRCAPRCTAREVRIGANDDWQRNARECATVDTPRGRCGWLYPRMYMYGCGGMDGGRTGFDAACAKGWIKSKAGQKKAEVGRPVVSFSCISWR